MTGPQKKPDQGELWTARNALAGIQASRFYERLDEVLAGLDFGQKVRGLCAPLEDGADGSQPSIDPVVYFKMVTVGFLENLRSDFAISARCGDSLMIRSFLGYELGAETPDSGSISRLRQRLSPDVSRAVFELILTSLRMRGLLRGDILGIHSAAIEANASLRALKHRNTEEAFWDYQDRLSAQDGDSVPRPAAPTLAERSSGAAAPAAGQIWRSAQAACAKALQRWREVDLGQSFAHARSSVLRRLPQRKSAAGSTASSGGRGNKPAGHLFKQFAAYGFGSVLLSVVPLLLIPTYVKHMQPAEYGTLALLDFVRNTVISVLTFVTASIIIKYHHSLEPDSRAGFFLGLWLVLLGFGLGSILLIETCGQTLFQVSLQIPYAPYGRLAVWTAFISVATMTMPCNLFRAKEQPRNFVVANLIGAVLRVVGVVYLVAVLHLGVSGALWAFLLQSIVMSPLGLWIVWRNSRPNIPWKIVWEAVRFGLPLLPSMFAASMQNSLDRVVLSHLVTFREVGIYSFAYQFGVAVNAVVGVVYNVWLPFYIARASDTAQEQFLKKASTFIVWSIILCGISAIILAKPAIAMINRPEYADAARLVPGIVLGYIFFGLALFPRAALMNQKRTMTLAVSSVIGICTELAINLTLVPRLGLEVAPWASATAFLVPFLLNMYALSNKSFSLWLTRSVAKVTVIGVLVLAVALCVSTGVPVRDASLRLLVILAGAGGGFWIIWKDSYGNTGPARAT